MERGKPNLNRGQWRIHQGIGNVALTDGSVQQLSSYNLRNQLMNTGDTSFPGPNELLFP